MAKLSQIISSSTNKTHSTSFFLTIMSHAGLQSGCWNLSQLHTGKARSKKIWRCCQLFTEPYLCIKRTLSKVQEALSAARTGTQNILLLSQVINRLSYDHPSENTKANRTLQNQHRWVQTPNTLEMRAKEIKKTGEKCENGVKSGRKTT